MPISQNTYTVPNNFVQQYDLGQKKIRADLVDENFTDAAGAINQLLTDDANTVHLTGAETISGNKTFTGTTVFGANTTGITPSSGDNSTKIATTAFVQAAKPSVPSASSSTPAARSTSGSVGTSTAYARADHSHPNNWGASTVAATSPAVVVKTWEASNKKSWYRKWSDGWVEQGIYVETGASQTVSLPVAMRDTKYIVTFGVSNSINNAAYTNFLCINGESTKTTTGFSTNTGSSYTPKTFYVCGYAAA